MHSTLWRQAFRWFREKYDLHGEPYISNKLYGYSIKGEDNHPNYSSKNEIVHSLAFHTYEEAELACLKKLIEIAKNK